MRVLSLDVGTKNLAYSIMSKNMLVETTNNIPYKIHNLGIINLHGTDEKDVPTCGGFLKNCKACKSKAKYTAKINNMT